MADKQTCPGCNAHLSSIHQAFSRGDDCPECGLSATSAMEVNAIRDRRGDVQLRDDLRLALLRAGRAEAALRVAERRLERVGEIVAGDLRQALTGDVGEL